MSVVNIGVGFMLLIAGRPVYPVFVGAMGYLLGEILDRQFGLRPAGWHVIAIPVLFAVLGFLGAFVLRRWSAWIAGFGAGAYLVNNLPKVFEIEPAWSTSWIAFFVAGALCVLLLVVIFDAFLVFLSTLTGVTLILTSTRFGLLEPVVIFFILLVFGVVTQYLIYEYAQPTPD